MSVSTYLKNIADNAILSAAEKLSIERSETALKQRLKDYFGKEISEQFRFGSYDRGTILPRRMDEFSDVDYMVIFSDGGFRPQTYLDKLRRFVTDKYTNSEISQSHPVIQLELNHIRFELVPAIKTAFFGIQIPQKDSSGQSWIYTDPKDTNDKISTKNADHKFFIKPLVRLVKYWNACNGYPFESFDLEKKVIGTTFTMLGFFAPTDIKGYFFEFIESFPDYWLSKSQDEKLQRAKTIIKKVKELESIGNAVSAEKEIIKLIPEVGITRRTLLG